MGSIIGIILIIIGGFWTLGRLLSQPTMFRITKEQMGDRGLWFALHRYIFAELFFGLAWGIGFLIAGVYLISPEFVSVFIWGIGIMLYLIFLWGSFAVGSLPQGTVVASGIFGFTFWGVNGLISGIVLGFIVSMLIGIFFNIFSKKLNISLIKKEYRIAIAKDFFSKHRENIISLERFQPMKDEEIIETFFKYFSEIQNEIAHLEDPIKEHKYDVDTGGYRENFEKGARNWADKFEDKKEARLMHEFVDFFMDAIYVNFDRYTS